MSAPYIAPAGAPDSASGVADLITEGEEVAASVSHPVLRERHRWAWAHRLSALDPAAAARKLAELPESLDDAIRLRMTVCRDGARLHVAELPRLFAEAASEARKLPAEGRLRVLNDLCESAITLADRDREAAVALILPLAAEVRALVDPDTEFQQVAALGCALIGEALLVLGNPLGRELLAEAEAHCENLLDPDPIRHFLANALAEAAPEHAAGLADQLMDAGSRMDVRLQIVQRTDDAALRNRLFAAAEADAVMVEHMRGPEALVRMGQAFATLDPDRAREFFKRAWESAEKSAGHQLRSLQWTGIAAALAPVDRNWARGIFEDALAAAREADEPVQHVVSRIVLAGEMAESFPQEAATIFQEAMEEALKLDAMWEHVHVLDVVFRPDASEFLDLTPVKAVLEEVLRRCEGDDMRVPGVFGLPDAARLMQHLDPPRALAALRTWYAQSQTGLDSDGMLNAALAIRKVDEEEGRALLEQVASYLRERVDCPAMGEYSRSVAPVAPDLVLGLAPEIPDRRERAEALTAAAVALWPTNPDRSLEVARNLERPVDRSSALLALLDRALNLSDRPQPQPLLEDLP